MIECPFCGESFDEDDLVFEFGWGEVATFFYNRKQLSSAPKNEYRDRPFYVSFRYGRGGRVVLDRCDTTVNPSRHPVTDPMKSGDNGWDQIVQLLSGHRVFQTFCRREDRSLPVCAGILPMVKDGKKRGAPQSEGMSTGIFCPICEQQLKPELLRAEAEVRILLSGRPGSGKTVYVTQAISELMQGRLAQEFTIEPANYSVQKHYSDNKDRLKSMGSGFVLATNPGVMQDPYIFLMRNSKNTIRLVIQDIAGEDTENRTKYSRMVRKADMLLFFIDPWHIEEVRTAHKRLGDQTNAIVDRSTQGKYTDLSGIFQQMLSTVDRTFTEQSGQLAGLLLIKGDYLLPPMLSDGDNPEFQMMQQPIPFNDPEEMEFALGMRSSFIRQCLHEWDSTRIMARDIESKYAASNTRYFISSALGQSTHLRQTDDGDDDPGFWDYDEQVLESPARPMNVIDPILWCLKRKGINF